MDNGHIIVTMRSNGEYSYGIHAFKGSLNAAYFEHRLGVEGRKNILYRLDDVDLEIATPRVRDVISDALSRDSVNMGAVREELEGVYSTCQK